MKDQIEEMRKLKHEEFLAEKAERSENVDGDASTTYEELGAWEKYNSGFASKYMKKMGYEGRGIGKLQNGIIQPIMPSINRGLSSSLLGGPRNLNLKERVKNNYIKPWPKGTTLITGDSILCGVQEKRLRNSKVRVFLGANVDDMYDYLTPLLKKKPTNIILHIGSNNAPLSLQQKL